MRTSTAQQPLHTRNRAQIGISSRPVQHKQNFRAGCESHDMDYKETHRPTGICMNR